MKAILRFDLPEEQVQFNMCSKAGDLYNALSDVKEWLRMKNKYGATPQDFAYSVAENNLPLHLSNAVNSVCPDMEKHNVDIMVRAILDTLQKDSDLISMSRVKQELEDYSNISNVLDSIE